jgi:hypothetical protein
MMSSLYDHKPLFSSSKGYFPVWGRLFPGGESFWSFLNYYWQKSASKQEIKNEKNK